MHRDLKLRNIILNTATNRVVITNFCLGKQLLNEDDYLHDQRGSPAYISPDVLSASHQKPYKGKPSDIWALGVVLYTMLYSQFPFFETKPAALFKRIKSVDYKIPKHTKVSEGTQYLIKNMLLLNPDDRLTATEIREQIEKMISNKRQFFLRIDQMVPEIDVQSRAKGLAGISAKETVTASKTNANPTGRWIPPAQEPQFELSRTRFTADSLAPVTPAAEELPEGAFYFPPREQRPTPMSVQHLANDARLLTVDEWGQYSRIIREHGGSGQPPSVSASATNNSGTTTTSSGSGAGLATSAASAESVSGTGSGNSSTIYSRMAARNAMRMRHLYNYSGRSPRSTAASGNGNNTPLTPAPLRTSDPMITSAVAAARAEYRTADLRLFQSILPRSTRYSSTGLSAAAAAHAGRSTPQLPNGAGAVGPGALSPSFTIRLRPQSAENLNLMLARIDRMLTNRVDDAAREFCNLLADMYSRGRIPTRTEAEQSDFNGVLTTELAEQIGDWLLQDCGESAIVRDIFSESTVNAKEKVVELLRRCGVQVDIGPTIEIKRAQNYESVIMLSYILQAAGYSCSYFA